jgi:drug/metabolite transporter (DMT)-like permease
LGPLITALLAFLLLGEHISLSQILGMLVLCAGTYLLETSRLTHGKEFMTNIWGNSHARNIMIGLLLYGCSSVGDRIILGIHTVPPLLYTALIQLCIAFFFVLYVWKKNGSPKSTFDAMRGSWMAILVLALLTIAYRVFQGYATALAAVGLVIAIKRSSSLITTVIGGEVFHEHNIWRKAGACLIMTLGVFLIASK